MIISSIAKRILTCAFAFATFGSAYAQTIDFNDNQLPAPWAALNVLGSNVTVANGALVVGPNTIGGVARPIATGSVGAVSVEYDVRTSAAGLNSFSATLLTSASFADPGSSTSGIASAGYGNANGPMYSTIIYGPQGSAYSYFDNRALAAIAPATVEFRVRHVFQNGAISQSLFDKATGALLDQTTTTVAGLQISDFQYLWLYSAQNAPEAQATTTFDNLVVSYVSATPPVAVATGPQAVPAGATATLNASNSVEPNGSALTYQWSIVGSPPGSQVTGGVNTNVTYTFTTDVVGVYTVQLVVTGPTGPSQPITVAVTAIAPSDYAQAQIALAANAISAAPSSAFAAPGQKAALQAALRISLFLVQRGLFAAAVTVLSQVQLLSDGSGGDWIVSQALQTTVYGALSAAIQALNL